MPAASKVCINISSASCCLDLFPQGFHSPPQDLHLGRIANSLPIHGKGTAVITIQTHHSTILCIHIPHSWTPMQSSLPSMAYFYLTKQNKKCSFHIFPNGCLFLLDDHIISLPYDLTSNLPVFKLLPLQQVLALLSFTQTNDMISSWNQLLWSFEVQLHNLQSSLQCKTTPGQYANLTQLQCQLYDWHVCHGHMNFAAIQSMHKKTLEFCNLLNDVFLLFAKNVSMEKLNNTLYNSNDQLTTFATLEKRVV